MSSTEGTPPVPSPPQQKSGARAALEYTGIPPSWFEKRPRLPSRNWLIFIGVTSSVLGFYLYDRRECKRIREHYASRVRYLAEEPLHSLDFPRKVTVYGAKWPGDDDWDRSTKYFRKYVKPILVSAAVDYEIIAGRRHGDLATRITEDIKTQRRIALGLEVPNEPIMPLPTRQSPEQKQRRLLDGGVVLVGRPAFKEYMAGLRRGWTESLQKVDREEKLARELESDGRFDELDELKHPLSSEDIEGEPLPTPSRLPPSRPGVFSPLSMRGPIPSKPVPAQQHQPDLGADVPPPAHIPPQPSLLLVPFTNYLGMAQVPLMIWDFFNERHKVRTGAESAYRIIMRETRPLIGPPPEPELSFSQPSLANTDFAFDTEGESYYKSSTAKLPSEIQKARDEYYKTLPEKLAKARQLARREREPTSDEITTPPPTEVELRTERMKKELRWTGDEKGWEIIRPDAPVEWDPRMEGALRVFVDPPQIWTESASGEPQN
ncbi:hypothetical protein EW146_g1690 [Bondarzewia mesenterica]|uniref:Mitochondrial import inner membrane translocase subunit TIM54 n=1 Tax=Bondarzewia mesenterica TaxID=1095465 RepID=A0A4S4M2Z4_9AGAM|nr:hypothetical protein EW146_g1690 [Bondarzewia mesenterica]